MARKRRAKNPRKKIAPPPEDPSAKNASIKQKDPDPDDTIYKKPRVIAKVRRDDLEEQEDDFELPPPQWCEENISFCCAVCCCREQDEDDDYPYIFPSSECLPHRTCCHNADKQDENWAPLYLKMETHLSEAFLDSNITSQLHEWNRPLEWIDIPAAEKAYNTALGQQSDLYNADGLDTETFRLLHHPDYEDAIIKPFDARCKAIQEGQVKAPAVVLDCFSGVGTGIVTLKRLGIAMSKVIHVEHDKVASHVYKHNHDHDYNPDLSDDHIEHVYEYPKWENLDVETFFEKHGPIDIILGGPPCVDYSRVNANRQGAAGEQGQYMIQFGQFIRTLERLQDPHPLYFCAENVWLSGRDRQDVADAFGLDWDPITLDALYLSPTRRKRMFLINFPYYDIDFTADLSHVGPQDCLEPGFSIPGHLVDEAMTAKAQCLMGSEGRIDEPNSTRMYVFREKRDGKGRYFGRPMNVTERELLMGYPKGYVEAAVSVLFSKLHGNGLSLTRRARKFENRTLEEDSIARQGQSWKSQLPKKYHVFAGNYHNLNVHDPYRCAMVKVGESADVMTPRIVLQMAPPVASDSSRPTFFDAKDYAKHLIGMAFSIPVMEHVLKPLQQIFETCYYEGYDYKFAWENQHDGEA